MFESVYIDWTSPNTFSPPVHPQNISSALDFQDVQRSPPSAILLDAHSSQTTQLDSIPYLCRLLAPSKIVTGPRRCLGSSLLSTRVLTRRLACAGTSSSRTALGHLPSRLRTSADRGISMRARRRRDPVPQSSNATSARSTWWRKPSFCFQMTSSLPSLVAVSYRSPRCPARKGCRPNNYRISSRPRDTSSLAVSPWRLW